MKDSKPIYRISGAIETKDHKDWSMAEEAKNYSGMNNREVYMVGVNALLRKKEEAQTMQGDSND